MKRDERDKDFLETFLKCSTCNNYIPYNSEICEYCGCVISYDDEKRECYISGRICFKCGSENKPASIYCDNCKSKFTTACPKCKHEIEEGVIHCKKCGFRIDELYIENEISKRLISAKTGRSQRTGLYVVGPFFFLLTLFFIFLSFGEGKKDIERIGFIVGAAIFCGFFITIVKNLIILRKDKNQ